MCLAQTRFVASTCVDAANSSDGNGVCTLFDGDDADVTFISEPGVQYYVYLVAEDADGNPLTNDNGTYELTLSCEAVLEGCTDPGACNYDEAANVEDGSCEIISCVLTLQAIRCSSTWKIRSEMDGTVRSTPSAT